MKNKFTHMIFNNKNTVLALACALTATTGMAFSTSRYAQTSRLASGKWVKIAIPETGVYEITDEELTAMGFGNPANVQVYGCGGAPISETLDGSYPDDLQAVNVARLNGKLCFYGVGPVKMSISNPTTSTPYFSRALNTYSTLGYYFLHEGDALTTVETVDAAATRGTNELSTSLGYYYHENDITSVSHSGKDMLGEDITSDGLTLPYAVPGNASTDLTVSLTVGATVTYTAYAQASIVTSDTTASVGFSTSSSRITVASNNSMNYVSASPVATVTLNSVEDSGNIIVSLRQSSGSMSLAKLDKFIITYSKNNAIVDGYDGQVTMGYASPSLSDVILLPDAGDDIVVWNVDDPNSPVQYATTESTDSLGTVVGREFTPGISAQTAEYVVFDPQSTLKKIESYEAVENQNLHAMEVPTMLIITDSIFVEQAERLAQLHEELDGVEVTVVDQRQVFNEFSSGTPDAMAYRLLCKMLYDRDNTTFKHLLLFGPMSYDNRGISTVKPHRLLSYQSDESASQNNSYVSTDIFAFLDDNSGSSSTLRSDMMRIGVGLYPVTSVSEAQSDVDKLIKYVATPDYGAWRNDALFMADTGDSDTHIFEAEGVNDLIESELGTGLNTNKVYVDMFQRSISDGTTSSEARRRIADYLEAGQYFATYVGHAGPLNFTTSKLWTSSLAQSTSYAHLPILTTACCEVAEYDDDERGIAEYMFHNATGGAIAMVATPRLTLNTETETMNRNFAKTVFSYGTNGYMPTLGEAYMKMKQNYGTASNGNKFCYTLLGDPLIKINYPKSLFAITTINGQAAESAEITVTPMQQITITAQVLKEGTEDVDTDFNGDATLTLYDAKRLLKSVTRTVNGVATTRQIYYPRDVLARVQGRVVSGEFTGSVVVPRHAKALDETALIRVYAHQDDTDNMVNGQLGDITIAQYDEDSAIVDDNAPSIVTMFLNDEVTFAEGAIVPANSTLYITASDDIGINTQTSSVGNTMKLLLDGGKTSYTQVKENAIATNDGRDLSVTYPLSDIATGAHTLTFTVFDVAGNSASRTISFIVTGSSDITLSARELPARDEATFDIDYGDIDPAPTVNLKVTDAHGKTVWTQSTSSFPVTWDLKDTNGERVDAGLYKFMGNYDNGSSYGGTNIGDLIVIDSVKTNK